MVVESGDASRTTTGRKRVDGLLRVRLGRLLRSDAIWQEEAAVVHNRKPLSNLVLVVLLLLRKRGDLDGMRCCSLHHWQHHILHTRQHRRAPVHSTNQDQLHQRQCMDHLGAHPIDSVAVVDSLQYEAWLAIRSRGNPG